MGKTRNARTAREEIPRGEGKEVSDLGGDQVAELGRHIEAISDGRGVQAAESSSKEVTGKDSPVEAPDWEQVTKHSCAAICAGEPGLDRPDEAPDGCRVQLYTGPWERES